jgi:S1-C subfamily serine protease
MKNLKNIILFTILCFLTSCSSIPSSISIPNSISEKFQDQTSLGTAFYIADDGFFLTAYHVVKNKPNIYVKVPNTKNWALAKLVSFSENLDVAIVKAPVKLSPVTFSSWERIPVGIEVYAVGFPMPNVQGHSIKITEGIVNSNSGPKNDKKLFQLSAGIQKGNSGGPVYSADGNVIGIVIKKMNELSVAEKTGDLPQNVNYALKSDEFIEFAKDNGVNLSIKELNLDSRKRAYEILSDNSGSIIPIMATTKDLKK